MADRDIDLCSELMIADPLTLPGKATVADAVRLLLDRGLLHVPVVDAKARFVGLFGASQVVRLLLPRAPMVGGDTDLSFAHETFADMRSRFAETAARPVAELAEADVPIVHPDTPLTRGLQLLYQTRTLVPVVGREDRRLMGVLAFSRLLERLRG